MRVRVGRFRSGAIALLLVEQYGTKQRHRLRRASQSQAHSSPHWPVHISLRTRLHQPRRHHFELYTCHKNMSVYIWYYERYCKLLMHTPVKHLCQTRCVVYISIERWLRDWDGQLRVRVFSSHAGYSYLWLQQLSVLEDYRMGLG